MFPNMNDRQMRQAMKKMGIKQDELDVREVIIKTNDSEIVISPAAVQRVNMQGQVSYQVSGQEQVRPISNFNDDDVKTVMAQANVSEDDAKAALKETDGDLAQAILNLSN